MRRSISIDTSRRGVALAGAADSIANRDGDGGDAIGDVRAG